MKNVPACLGESTTVLGEGVQREMHDPQDLVYLL